MPVDDGDAGEGGSLDFSPYTYDQLRTAVFAVDEEAIRVNANEWGDLRRRLNERIGTLRVMIHRLEPDWHSPAGRQALQTLRDHLARMTDLGKMAAWNEDRFDNLYETYARATRQMKDLDDTRGGQAEVASNPGGGGAPLPPHLADRRQPRAAQIAHDIYSEIAITASTLDVPFDSDDWGGKPIDDGAGSPGEDPGVLPPGASSGPGGGSVGIGSPTSIGPFPAVPPPSKAGSPRAHRAGWREPSGGTKPSVRPRTSPARTGGQSASGEAPAVGLSSSRGTREPGDAPASARSVTGGPGQDGHVPGRTGGGHRGVIGPPTGGTSNPPPPNEAPGSRVLGGGPRPGDGSPAAPGTDSFGTRQPIPPGGVPGGLNGGSPPNSRGGRRRAHYERGEPNTFVDRRHSTAPVLGQRPVESTPVTAGPGVIGQQKHSTTESEPRQPQRQQSPSSPTPEGFPDRLKDGSFTSRDGAMFTVRRHQHGT